MGNRSSVVGKTSGKKKVAKCPDGKFLVGVNINSGDSIDKINKFYCRDVDQILKGSGHSTVQVNAGGDGGKVWGDRFAPRGYAISTLGTNVSGTGRINRIEPVWRHIDELDHTKTKWSENRYGAGKSILRGNFNRFEFLKGMTVYYDNILNGVELHYGDFSEQIDPNSNPAAKMRCCMGTSKSTRCGNICDTEDKVAQHGKSFCRTEKGIKTPECQEWCRENTTYCDKSVTAFCKKNPKHPYCSCMKTAPISDKLGLQHPKCFDQKCLDTGYITTNGKNVNCRSITNCEVTMKLKDSGVTLAKNINVDQSCGQGKTEKEIVDEVVKDDFPDSAPVATSMSGLYIFFFIIFLLAVVAGILLGIRYMNKPK